MILVSFYKYLSAMFYNIIEEWLCNKVAFSLPEEFSAEQEGAERTDTAEQRRKNVDDDSC